MNWFKKYALPCIGAVAAAALWGCSSSASDDRIMMPGDGGDASDDFTIYDYEMYYNYQLLDIFYSYGHTNHELGEFEDYYLQGSTVMAGSSYCTPDFGNVCYMYGKMKDPFTRYYSPDYAEIIYSMLTESEEEVGIGAMVKEVGDEESALVVTQVYAKGPAEKAGLAAGDTILAVGTTKVTVAKDFQKLTSGTKGEVVEITVIRDGAEKTVKISLDSYLTPTVYLTFEDSIPVIQITEFTETTVSDSGTYGEFLQILNQVKDDYKSVIIDLRDNPGGDGDQCNNVSAELLAKGDTIITDIETNVDSAMRAGEMNYFQKFDTTTYIASEDGIGKDLYYVFLANSGSASCAEVMLSAVTVNKKTPVIGQISYGKGIGQYVMPTLANGLALISGLQCVDKNGDIYHKVGIVPDYEIDDPDAQMAKAIELAKEATEKRTAGYGTVSTGNFDKKRAMGSKGMPSTRREFLQQLNGHYKVKDFKK